jgi:hypothetical protein
MLPDNPGSRVPQGVAAALLQRFNLQHHPACGANLNLRTDRVPKFYRTGA